MADAIAIKLAFALDRCMANAIAKVMEKAMTPQETEKLEGALPCAHLNEIFQFGTEAEKAETLRGMTDKLIADHDLLHAARQALQQGSPTNLPTPWKELAQAVAEAERAMS
jgi:hypothetical protein